MHLKEKLNQLSKNKKNTIYWIGIILLINLFLVVQHATLFAKTGQCRNYMAFGSEMHLCTWAEFIKYGHGWLAFTNLFLLLPAASIMVFASNIVDVIFAKPKE